MLHHFKASFIFPKHVVSPGLVRQYYRQPELLITKLTAQRRHQVSSHRGMSPLLLKHARTAATVMSARQPRAHCLLHDRGGSAPTASPALAPGPWISRTRSSTQRRTPLETGKPVGDMNGRDHSGRWDALLRLHLGMIGRCAGVVVVVEDEFAVAVAAVATVIALADELDRLLVVGGGGFDGVCRVCGGGDGGRAGHARDSELCCSGSEGVALLFLLKRCLDTRLLRIGAHWLSGVLFRLRDISVKVADGGIGARLSGLRARLTLAVVVRGFTLLGVVVSSASSCGLCTLAASCLPRRRLQCVEHFEFHATDRVNEEIGGC